MLILFYFQNTVHEDSGAKNDKNVKVHENHQIENDSSDLKVLGAFSLKNAVKSFASIREPQENITKKELLKFR